MSRLYEWLMEKEVDENKVLLTTQSGSFTFKKIEAEINRYTSFLKEIGGVSRKKVVIINPIVHSSFSLGMAINRLDGILIPVSPLLRKEDLQSMLNMVKPHIIFTVEHHNGTPFSLLIDQWAASYENEVTIVTSTDCQEWTTSKKEGAVQQLEQNERLHIIGCTSGSTGIPKGIMTGNEFIEFVDVALKEIMNLTEEDTVFLMAPTSSLFGFCWLITGFHNRNKMMVTESFQFPEIMQLMRENRPNKLTTSPSLFKALYMLDKANPDSVLDSVELVNLAGENVTPEFIDSIGEVKSCKITSGYGISEVGAIMYTSTDIREGMDWSILPGVEYHFLAEEDGAGELLFKTKFGFMGYYGQEQLSKEVFPDGWFHSGDMARLTADQKISIVGRKKDMIKKGGQQVIPGEIEKFIGALTGVDRTVVVGIPHSVYGESVIAFIKEQAGSTVEVQSVFDACRENLARFKVPDHVYIIEEMPLIQGKIDKVTLRQLAIENSVST